MVCFSSSSYYLWLTNTAQNNHNMDNEEKIEYAVQARIAIPADVHARIVKHQTRLIGRRGEKLTFGDAVIDLLEKATKSLK